MSEGFNSIIFTLPSGAIIELTPGDWVTIESALNPEKLLKYRITGVGGKIAELENTRKTLRERDPIEGFRKKS